MTESTLDMKMESRPTEITCLLNKEQHHKLTANLMFLPAELFFHKI
jgi:hypothetical protein